MTQETGLLTLYNPQTKIERKQHKKVVNETSKLELMKCMSSPNCLKYRKGSFHISTSSKCLSPFLSSTSRLELFDSRKACGFDDLRPLFIQLSIHLINKRATSRVAKAVLFHYGVASDE
ncbi:CLUMA_CG018335, isoform A [Clunio marinus]|uniref:CLUMA_CG018335, isoform A n=1 Tax=Clunio marinus TaxID=568069 RepID=A0A1J1IY40_9DIPT|nr:CLUMA_CG018335, isoform A [Clunio marinus]